MVYQLCISIGPEVNNFLYIKLNLSDSESESKRVVPITKKAIKSSDLHFMAQKIGGGSRFLQKLKILQNLPEKKEGCSVPPPASRLSKSSDHIHSLVLKKR